jgi:hypothetical protein
MRKPWQSAGYFVLLVVSTNVPGVRSLAAGAAFRSTAQQPEIVACQVLEGHTSPQLHVTVVLFHQRNEKDRARLGSLLREHSDVPVEFQGQDGTWHPATVVRLKSCFGRGLLVFATGSAQLTEKDQFSLKFVRQQNSVN